MADATTKAGLETNLIIDVFPDKHRKRTNPPAKAQQRLQIATLPAIPDHPNHHPTHHEHLHHRSSPTATHRNDAVLRSGGRMPASRLAADLPAAAEVARFRSASGVMECHVTVRLTGGGTTEPARLSLEQAYQLALDAAGIDASSAVFRRVFCSDVVNQAELFGSIPPCAIRHVSARRRCPRRNSRCGPITFAIPDGAVEKTDRWRDD